MKRKRLVVGGALAVVVASGALAARIGSAAGTDVRTIAVGAQPWAVAVDAGHDRALVVNRTTGSSGYSYGAGSVSLLKTSTGALVRTMAVGPDPRAVAVDDHLGRAFVPNDDDATVSVLDTRSGAPLATISVGSRPHAIALDAQTHRAFVLNTGDNSVSVLDTRRDTVVRTIHLGENTSDASVGAQGLGRGYASYGGQAVGGQGFGFAFGFNQGDAALDVRTNRVFLALGGVIRVLDARSGALLRTVTIPGASDHLAIDSQAGQVFVAGSGGVSVLDGRTGRLLRTLVTGTAASAVAVDARRGLLFVARAGARDADGTLQGPGTVLVLDARTGASRRTAIVGVAPSAVAVDEASGQAVVVNTGGRVRGRSAWSWVPGSLQQWVPASARQPAAAHTDPGSVSVIAGG